MRAILEIMCKRFPEIVWIAVGVFAVIMIGTYFATPQYVSEARILVPIGREATVPATALTQPLNVFINRAEQIQTQLEVLYSRSLIEKTLESLPPDMFKPVPPAGLIGHLRHYSGRVASAVGSAARWSLELVGLLPRMTDKERVILNCQDRFSATRQKETELIIISFRHPSPYFAQAFLAHFLDIYVREKSLTNAGLSVPFFAEQERELETRLVRARGELAAFRTEWGILDLEVQREQLVREYGRLITAINENRAELVQVELALHSLGSPAGQAEPESLLPATLRQDPGIVETLRNLAALRSREGRLGTEIGGKHPDRGNVQKEIALLRSSIRAEGERILQNRRLGSQALLHELETQRDALQSTVRTLDAKGREMRSLETSVDVLEKALAQYGEKRETSRVSNAMDERQINAIRMVEAANLAYKPVSPKPLRNLVLGVVFGLLAGLAYAFASNALSSTINTLDDLKTCFPDAVAVYIPDMAHDTPTNLHSRLFALLPPLWRSRGKRLPAVTDPGPKPAARLEDLPDQVLTMLTRRFFYRGSERHFPSSLLLTGAGRGVGVSGLTLLIARHVYRVYGLRVLLVRTAAGDALPERPGVPTFADWLRGGEPPPPGAQSGLTIMPAGTPDEASNTALFALTRDRLAALGEGYDMVLYDSAPVAWDSVAFHLASLVEEVIVVTLAEQTRKEVLADAAAGLVQSGARVLGAICNRRRFYIPGWLYARIG